MNHLLNIIEVEITTRRSKQPGEVSIENNKIYVGTGDYDVKINIVQPDKEGIFSAKAFLQYTQNC